MAEKEQQSPYPMLPANGPGHSDVEAMSAHNTREQRKKKRNKCILYIVLFAIFQCAVIAVFAVTIAKVRTPRFRVNSATLQNVNTGNSTSNPTFTGTVNARFSIKNANFGRYKYHDTNIQFFYRGTPVGGALVPNSHVGWRATRSVNVGLDLNLGGGQGNTQLGSDLTSGVVPITSRARMTGRVELIFVMKRNRATNMNCAMEIVTATQQIRNIVCN